MPGHLRVMHLMEWADPPAGGWPRGVDAYRLAQGCRGCGSDLLATEKRLALSPGGELGEVPWVVCHMCGRGEAGVMWAWLKCWACGSELRATVSS